MQSRIRKTRCYKRTWWTRKIAFTCFGIILTSCSTVSNVSHPDRFSKVVRNLCFNSSGRGRIKIFKQTTIFSYESVNLLPEQTWKMAVDIPIHGEELLIINWKEADKNRTKLKGKFGTRIFTSAKNHPDAKKYLPLLKTFIKGWSQIIFLNNQLANSGIENYCKGQSCKLGSSHWTWSFKDGHLYIDYKISKMSSLRFDFSDFVDGAPRRVSVSPPGQVTQNAPFQLDLFLSACE